MTRKEATRLSLTVLLWYGAIELVGAILAKNATGAAGVQAVVAELGAGRMGVTWSDPHGDAPPARALVRRALEGAGLGAIVAIVAIALAVLGRGATIAAGRFSVAPVLGGLVVAALLAVRDELVLRGMVLRVFRPVVGDRAAMLVCGALAAAARWGQAESCGPVEAAGAAALAIAFAGVWLVDRGAWRAVGAHTGLFYVADTLARGSLLDVRATAAGERLQAWGGGDAGLQAGLAWLVTAAAAAAIAYRFAGKSR